MHNAVFACWPGNGDFVHVITQLPIFHVYTFGGTNPLITAEVLYECWNLTLELDVERLYDVQAAVARLTGDNPVDVGVVVHTDADGRIYVHVAVAT